ncbi:ferredoxin [Caldicoprobacter guelmensis]|uniref:4Fe-4S binding protein n=1 Tax=Caldicoprobacter guelmensis TaxID=1170224 RepID=UPI00195EC2E8|nr:ferredoxin [Caldicoprobacter guelmensis]
MIRKIVKIDQEKCNGCGLCIDACHEGALQLINGKATLVSESYCDGLGACLPECPMGAISIEEREAQPFDEEAVKQHMMQRREETLPCGCPGTQVRSMERSVNSPTQQQSQPPVESQLRQWPCQIRLVPPNAPYFRNASLLVAADCTAYAYANIHQDFMRNKVTIIGCPKLDDVDYSDKLTDILKYNDIKSITVLKMEVPCCSGLAYAVRDALARSSKMIPWRVVTISIDGKVIED